MMQNNRLVQQKMLKAKLPFSSRVFDPTDEELVVHYLRNHILGLSHSTAPIREAVVFGEKINPWDKLCDPLDPYPWQNDSTSTPTLFLFTRLSNVGNTEKSSSIQKNRRAGCGTWHGTCCLKEVFSTKNNRIKVGNYRILSFRSTNGEETKGQWTMYEYTISAQAFPEILNVKGWQDQVICRLKRNDNKSNVGGKVSKKSNPVSNKRRRNVKEEEEEKVVAGIVPPESVNESVQEHFPVDGTGERYNYGEWRELDGPQFDVDEMLQTLGSA